VLSGKYLGGANPPGARLTLWDRFSRYKGEVPEAAIAAYVGVARKYGLDPAQLALAYVNEQPFVTSNIIGATSLEQLATNIASVDVRLPRGGGRDRARSTRIPNPCP
jgi:aryl-alcohol dehydrogenase-like predicted oxidoreductase